MGPILITILLIGKAIASDGLDDCDEYEEAWRITQCATELMKDKMISNGRFIELLNSAILKGAALTTFYGVGLTTGLETYLLAGTVKNPTFEKSYALDYNPTKMCLRRILIDMIEEYDKPVLLFTDENVTAIPEWTHNYLNKFQHTGANTMHAFFSHRLNVTLELTEEQSCTELNTWISENWFYLAPGMTILMDNVYWCPNLENEKVIIALASIHEEDRLNVLGKTEQSWKVDWLIHKGGTTGKVPEEHQLTFGMSSTEIPSDDENEV